MQKNQDKTFKKKGKESNPVLDVSIQNTRKYDLELKGFFSDQTKNNEEFKNPFIIQKKLHVSLITENKTIYICLGKTKEWNHNLLKQASQIIVSIQDWNFDVNINSLVQGEIKVKTILEELVRNFYYLRYKKLDYKTTKKNIKEKTLNLVLSKKENIEEARKKFKEAKAIIEAVNWCRELQDSPPNYLNSLVFSEYVKKRFAKEPLVQCEVLDKKAITLEKMNLILAVNAGSQFEPRVVILKYLNNPASKEKTILVGKGITFDTGGYSLKPSQYQIGMKYDMSGAAAVVSAIEGIAKLKLKINVIAIVAITDNCIGSKATLVESVIMAKNGTSVEITNTDAEGRLVLADAISYAKEKWAPKEIIELSTLTGAILVTLGETITGAFTNHKSLYEKFETASKKVNETIWKLPVMQEHHKNMKSNIADLVNASKSYKGGASNAAAFLFHFAQKTPFLHLDIAGTATKPENTRGTGIMIQTIIQFLYDKTGKKEKK